jgi:hypothetical protein
MMGDGSYADVFLSRMGHIVVLKKNSIYDETTKAHYASEEKLILESKTLSIKNQRRSLQGPI